MPIYRNKETGHEVEVMRGTRLPKVYEEVKKGAAAKSTAKNDNVNQPKDTETKTAKSKAGKNTKDDKGDKETKTKGDKEAKTPTEQK